MDNLFKIIEIQEKKIQKLESEVAFLKGAIKGIIDSR